ncbi:alpha/beta hydrolase [Streptomyces fradiae]|uniref:alpha/beta hydrolase n=1 Tax=Streptomyces fradiae TaxID=1906 RepID=UPI0035BE250C
MTPSIAPSSLTVWRTLLALSVIFVLLATSGWTGPPRARAVPPDAWEAATAAWQAARVDGRTPPDPLSPPAAVAAFFAALRPAQRARLARQHPLVVGNLNGAPVDLRYQANGRTLRRALAAERLRVADPRLSPDGRREATRRVHRITALLSTERQVLAFDPEGRGRVAEVLGDLERAERVSVVVPGVDTHLLTYQRTARRYTAPYGMAEALYAAEREAEPDVRTAVIAWADYTAPTGVGMDAVTGRLAAEGSVRLASLVEALPGDSRVTLFCHSYGSVVCGLAARHLPPRVADIAVAGSPGMRAETAAALGTRARVWAMRDDEDWIADVPHLDVGGLGHGADPVGPGFGARLLSADGAAGHGGYFVPGTRSLRNFAVIGVGSYGDVRCAGATDACRSGIHGATPV